MPAPREGSGGFGVRPAPVLLTRTVGVVVIHKPDRAVSDLPAVRQLMPQVDEVLIVRNGPDGENGAGSPSEDDVRIGFIPFDVNRGTAAAWNTAVSWAGARGHRYLYILDQDSVPSSNAVATALAEIALDGVAAVVQPAAPDRLGLLSFPWDTVASGSLYEVELLSAVGGFDERLFVDEVDHEMLARLMAAGYEVKQLATATIDHQVGSPRDIRILGLTASIFGHGLERQRLRGYSTGLLARRYLRRETGTAARLLLREALIAVKNLAGGERDSTRALLTGLVDGVSTGQPPSSAAARSCPYCEGALLGRFADVPDWRFGTGTPADVYKCSRCGALAAGRVPGVREVASWYSDYYTHTLEAGRVRAWSRFWPTPRRRREMRQLRSYFTDAGARGRLLDVGTGAGDRLVQFADAGWEVVGQDLDPRAGHLARARGLEVHHCPVPYLVGREQPFDVIGLSHVLEHATDPAALLEACAALLAPAGRLCVISPNAAGLGRRMFGRWWYGLEQPRHLAIPTLESLDRLTSRLGLQVVHAGTMATNSAVILGGSLARVVDEHMPPGLLRRCVRAAAILLGQAMGRTAILLDHRLGEEVVWIGRRPAP